MAKQPPAFLFYYKDFLASTAAMSVAEVGAYLRLLCYQWEHGFVPTDETKLARIIQAGSRSIVLWRGVKDRFSDLAQGSCQNARLERVRAEVSLRQSDRADSDSWRQRGTKPAQYVRTSALALASASVPPSLTDDAPPNGDAVPRGQRSNDGTSVHAERFARFWAAYPKKVGKDAAWREWLKRSPSSDLTDSMIAKVQEHRASPQWLRDGGQYIPHPRTWLSQGRWQDEPDDTLERPQQPDMHGHYPPCKTIPECTAKVLADARKEREQRT